MMAWWAAWWAALTAAALARAAALTPTETALWTWAESQGANVSRIVPTTGVYGRGLAAVDGSQGELLSLPRHLIMGCEAVARVALELPGVVAFTGCEDGVGRTSMRFAGGFEAWDGNTLVVFVAHHRLLGAASPWAPYLDSLPASFDTLPPYLLAVAAVGGSAEEAVRAMDAAEAFEGGALRDVVQKEASKWLYFSRLVAASFADHAGVEATRALRTVLWAKAVVATRAVHLSSLGRSLVPFWDLINHGAYAAKREVVDDERVAYVRDAPSDGGELVHDYQLSSSTGGACAWDWLITFGFVPRDAQKVVACARVRVRGEVFELPADAAALARLDGEDARRALEGALLALPPEDALRDDTGDAAYVKLLERRALRRALAAAVRGAPPPAALSPGPKRVAILFAGEPRALSATFDDAGFAFKLDEWRRLDGPDDRLPVDAIKSAMRNEGIYKWAAPPPPPAHDAAFAAHASLVDLFRENVYLALHRQGVEFDAFWWLHARSAVDVGPLERLVCPLLRPPAAAGASYECVVREHDTGDPLLRIDVERAGPTVWSTFLDPSQKAIGNFLAMLHDLVRVDEMREARERATGAAYSHVLRLRPDLAVWQPLPATLFDESPNLYIVARATYVGGNEGNFMAARADVARAAMRWAEVLQDPGAWSGWNMTRGAPVPRPPNWPRSFYSPHYDMMPNTWWPEDWVAHAIKRAGGTVSEHADAKARVIHSSTRHAPPGAAAGPDVAVLLVGADYDVADEAVARAHFVLMRDEVAGRLRAETFAVGDECGGGLVAYAREYLNAVAGVVGAGADGCRGFPPPPAAEPAFPGMQQWFRVQCAWELMEAREAARAETYSVVVRLRPDATPYPWDAALVRAAAAARRDVVFAATDHAFWGSRPAVAVAARLWPAIGGLFAASATPNVAFSVRAFRDSLASLPAEARSHDTWTFYSKVGVLAAPGGARPSVDDARTALAALHQQGVSYVTPGDVDLDFGRLANDRWDTWPRYFAAESDFIAWLLYNNITACDLGVGTHMLFRGVAHARAPGVCRVEADAAGSA